MIDLLVCVLIAGATVCAMLYSRLRAPLGADEGFLWYGVRQLLHGRVPHCDFRGYEPGRYLWSGVVALLAGRGLFALRLSTHLFFAVALCVALLLLRRLGLDWVAITAAAVALTVLAHPQHKQFEHGWALLVWAACTHVLLVPSVTATGVMAASLGVSLFFGFNLLVYGGAASALVLAVLLLSGRLPFDATTWVSLLAGGVLGLLPFAVMCLFPGFARTFWQRRFVVVFARGETNLALPRPWPWRPLPRQLSSLHRTHAHGFQWMFLALFAVPIACLVLVFGMLDARLAMGLIAAAALGLMLSHHAYSRADPAHMTQTAGPLCLAIVLLASSIAMWATVLVAAIALWLVWPLQPLVQRRARPAAFRRRVTGGLAIDYPLAQARVFEAAEAMCMAEGIGRRGFFAAPAFPALYAAFDRDSPVYDTFPLFPLDADGEQRMIAELEQAGVRAALVSDAPIDGRDELRFSRTHPRVWRYLQATFTGRQRKELGPDIHSFDRPAPHDAPLPHKARNPAVAD